MREYHYSCGDDGLMPYVMNYTYVAVHPALRPYIAHYTVRYPQEWAAAASPKLSLVPDASGCLLLFYDGSRLTQFLWGPTTKLVEVSNTNYRDLVHVFVEFRPGGLSYFFGGAAPALTNLRIALDEVDYGFSHTLENLFFSADTMCEFLSALNHCFLSRLLPERVPPLIRAALRCMEGQYLNGILVRDIARDFCCSERHLSRLFHESLGLPAKGYLKILRVNRAISLMQGTAENLSQIAHSTGFYDQSHFIREFKAVCFVSPSQYRRNANQFYHEPLKLNPLD